ncbi:WSSV085 [White spot syndrome virus]|uniref:WSSV085 n=1 Tax=White spot syndrome virus TaxID=342409 RepID=A0A2I6SBL1_9VIRU|nr:WSSV085 [White spot syndrome virus]
MGTKFMVAPGSLLNANKEETLRLNRLSDINNVRHYGTDVHGRQNSAWRIGEVVRAASSFPDGDKESAMKKMLLLGSVSAISAQKSASHINDPTALLSTNTSIQNLVKEAFPDPVCSSNCLGSAESTFATQLAYRQRLFPNGDDENVTTVSNICPMDLMGSTKRYNDAFNNIFGSKMTSTNKGVKL